MINFIRTVVNTIDCPPVPDVVSNQVLSLLEGFPNSPLILILSPTFKVIVVGGQMEILNGNISITGGWNGSKSMSYNYSSTPTKNTFSFDNIKSAIVNANFGYYADAGKQEACKLTINILRNGSVAKTASKEYSMTGFGSGTANISASVDCTGLTGNCQVHLVMAVTKADGSHVNSSSSFASCYLNT